jgi:large subunit ribosomal protein L10
MALNMAQKQAIVAEVAEVAANAHSAIAAEYRGLTVDDMTSCASRRATAACI